ncbi:uncharacterized protein [Venturia canescens]|uniref:uncharacterized protein n=1 Tax=Venturia canescens TaxID=32260 RepID=UPI001C9C38C5|nr:uncharacterized protein LOC122410172 [Venturia canescens]
MLRPRILSNYNGKQRDCNKKEKDIEAIEHQVVTSQMKNVQPNHAKLTTNNDADNNMEKTSMRFEMGVSLSKEQSVTCTDGKIIQTTTQHSINVVQLTANSSTKVYQLMPEFSKRVGQSTADSMITVGSSGQNLSTRVGKPATSHSSDKVVKLAPQSSTRVAPFSPDSLEKVAELIANPSLTVTRAVPNSTKKISRRIQTFSPILSRVSRNSTPRITQVRGANSRAGVAELIPDPSTRIVRLMSNTCRPVLELTPTGSPKIGQTAPRSPKKVPPLIKFSPTRAIGLTPNSPTSTVRQVYKKPCIKSIEQLTKADGHNFVMILPVSEKEATTVQSQTASMCEIIQNPKDVARVQQVIGIPRSYGASENNFLENNSAKLTIVSPRVIKTKRQDSVPKEPCSKSKNKDNIEFTEKLAKINEIIYVPETTEEKILMESEKSVADSNETDPLEIFPQVEKADSKQPDADTEFVDAKESMNKPEPSRKRSRTFVSKKKQSRALNLNKKKGRTTGPNSKSKEEKISAQKTARMMTRMRKSTILMTRRRNTRPTARPNQMKPKMSTLLRMQSQITKTLANLGPPVEKKWLAQCIICKDRFTDKYEFHRHATLSHPGIRIVFCELCNASFRSDIELKEHRYSYHKITVTKDAENNLIKLEAPKKQIVKRGLKNVKTVANERRVKFESTAGHSNDHFPSRPIIKKVPFSNLKTGKSEENSQLHSVATGPRATKSQNQTMKSRYIYVDNDIVNHKTIINDETFVNAEKRKLTIPIVKLDGLALEKYSMKFVTKALHIGFAGSNQHEDLTESNNKPAITSKETPRLDNPKLKKMNGDREHPVAGSTLRNRRKEVFKDKQDATISNANSPAPRRSMRRRKKKIFDDAFEKYSNDEFAKTKPSDDAVESPKKEKYQKLEDSTSDNSRSSQDFTLIDIEDEDKSEVAKSVEKQKVDEKSEPPSSAPTCDQVDANRVSLNADDVDMGSVSSPKQKESMHSSEKASESKLASKDSSPERLNVKSTRRSSKLKESQSLRMRASKSPGSDVNLIRKRALRLPRFSCDNLYDDNSSIDSDGSTNRDAAPDDTPNKQDKRAIVNKKLKEKRYTQRKGKGDDKNKLSEEKIDGEDNQEKKQNSGDGKNLDEKSTNDGERNRSANKEEKQSKPKSNVSEKLGKKQSDDEDEEPKRRINDKDKKPKEKIEDEDDEKDEKPEDKTKRLRGRDRVRSTNLENKSKCEQLNNSDDPDTRNQPEFDSNDGDIKKCLDEKNDSELVNQKEIENSSQTNSTESSVQKTHSTSKKPPSVSKQMRKTEVKIKKADNFCSVCRTLCALMKKICSQVGDRNTNKIPVKCPLCQRYFISTFHLELHVATNHLQCENDIPCKIAVAPSVEKPSPDTQSETKANVDMVVVCLRCSIKLNTEKELTEHLFVKHQIRYSKVQSPNELPEYIRDLRMSLLGTNCRKKVATASKSSERTDLNSTLEIDTNKLSPATLGCSFCDEKFVDSTKYVRHVREIHNTIKASACPDKKIKTTKSLSTQDKLCSMSDEPLPNVSEASSTSVNKFEGALKTQKVDSLTSDRDYVLKQLLSDDSSDDERKNSSKNNRSQSSSLGGPAKENIVQKYKGKNAAERSSRSLSFENSQRTFGRTEDLSLRRLTRVDEKILKDGENGKNESKTEYEDRSEVLVQSDSEDEDNFGESDELEYDEFSPMKEKIIPYRNERERDDNVAVLFGTNGASEKVVVGSKRRATLASYEMSQISKDEETAVPVKTQKTSDPNESSAKSLDLTKNESENAGICELEESLEMEVGEADENNEKLPIACGKCNRHFANRTSLNEHLFFLHDDSLKDTVLTDVLTPIGGSRGSEEPESPQRWTCEICDQNFKLFQAYSRHKYFVHGDDSMVHVCDNCSKVITNVTMVNVHICTDVASYNCRACNETFTSGMSLRLHNTEKHMETNGVHSCNDCKKNFLTNGMLERHIISKHQFVRPHQTRKASPVRMAKPDSTNDEDFEKPVDSERHCNEEINEAPTEGNPGEDDHSIKADDTPAHRRGRWRSSRSKKKKVMAKRPIGQKIGSFFEAGKKKRGRKPKIPVPDDESSAKSSQDEDDDAFEEHQIVYKDKSVYVDDSEIQQCAMCQLYCLSRSTLRDHMTKIHSIFDEICQLCQKMYPNGKLIRHMIERHITSDNGEVLCVGSSWRLGGNCNEIDAEILMKMLGIDRLVSLCEYRRYSEKIDSSSYPCVTCKKQFNNHELYRYHFLLHHDTFCALCNIEFKTGHDAARHKIEVHGSVGRYIWFADRIVSALTSTKNFTNTTERIFMERITRDEKAGNDEAEEIEDDEEAIKHSNAIRVLDSTAMREKTITVNVKNVSSVGQSIELDSSAKTTSSTSGTLVPTFSSEGETLIDNASGASDNSVHLEDVSLIIVVTDDDLERFNITTRYPNIWGLSAKISSTYNEITPKQVKEMLECHFEREEDFDS